MQSLLNLSKKNTIEILKNFNKKPLKSLGQNYLIDFNIVNKFFSFCNFPLKDSLIIEIGPGIGALTKVFLSKGYKILAIEIDSFSINILMNLFKLKSTGDMNSFKQNQSSFLLFQEDFMKFDLEKQVKDFSSEIFIIGSLPYYLTSSILFKLFEKKPLIKEMVFIIQKEVVERITSKENSKQYGLLSVISRYFYHIKKGFLIQKNAFYPIPKVESRVIYFKLKEDIPKINYFLFKSIVKSAFNQRRKQLMKALNTSPLVTFNKEIIDKTFNCFPNMKTMRADQISFENYLEFSEKYEFFLTNVSN